MGSKFSKQSPVQKPPQVCKAPPPPDQVPGQPFDLKHFQGFATWDSRNESEEYYLTGFLEMSPGPDPNTWTGETEAGSEHLRLVMVWHPTLALFGSTLFVMLEGGIEDTRIHMPTIARTMEPFDTGLVIYNPSIYAGAIASRIMS